MRPLSHKEMLNQLEEQKEEYRRQAIRDLVESGKPVTELNISLQLVLNARTAPQTLQENYDTIELAERVRSAKWNTNGTMSRDERREAAREANIKWGLYRKIEKLIC